MYGVKREISGCLGLEREVRISFKKAWGILLKEGEKVLKLMMVVVPLSKLFKIIEFCTRNGCYIKCTSNKVYLNKKKLPTLSILHNWLDFLELAFDSI